MTLYRVFPWAPRRFVRPLDVPRERQGANRHDNPDLYTALYLSRDPASAIAEAIQAFRGRTLTDVDFERSEGRRLALAALDDSDVPPLVDLDDPAVLLAHGWRPSQVATRRRATTQAIGRRLYEGGAAGCSWWSALEAEWTNVTLFGRRGGPMRLAAPTEPLSLVHPGVVAAADRLGVTLARAEPIR
jgi:RES domain-containing protein